ncbi:MAG: DUF4157 domain-containing protein [Nostoc sp.]|uniref:eCIS core domain-containing protein n=1 Tax=Nostoc sp. TaxID=1180 RepID=UPI002FFC2E37
MHNKRLSKTPSSINSNSQAAEQNPKLAYRPFGSQIQKASAAPVTQSTKEDVAFAEQKMEAFGLELQAKYGKITPEGQERLTVLQAKMASFSSSQLEHARRFSHNIANIPLRRPDTPTPIQAKLTIGEPGDKYEQEADKTARQVVQRIHQPQSEKLQRESLPEEELQMKPMVQRRVSNGGMAATQDLEASINQARGGGQPLAKNIREPMEQGFGADFSRVKVHTDTQADQLNRSIQAKAFTTGQDVFFRQGAYEPESRGGQELIAHELTHVVQQNESAHLASQLATASLIPHTSQLGSGIIVQKKPGAGFLDYLRKNRLPSVITPTEHQEIISAWLLDQNVHDLVDMMTENVLEPVLQNIEDLKKLGLNLGNVIQFLQTKGCPSPTEPPEKHMSFLDSFMKQTPKWLTQNISGSTNQKKNHHASIIEWVGLTPWGAGTGVKLTMRPGGLPQGSPPKGSPIWMKRLEQHVPPDGSTTIYVQGHLLNHNIGGPGLDYNMVPLTGKPAKNVGGNDANGEHLNGIEKEAKNAWEKVKKGEYQEAVYKVTPDYSRSSRPETIQVRQEANKMREIHQEWLKDIIAFIGQKSPQIIEKDYKSMFTELGIPIPNPLPSTQEMVNQLATQKSADDVNKTLLELTTANHPLAQKVTSQINAEILGASAQGKANNTTFKDLFYLLAENAATWEYEDIYVPTKLDVDLKWTNKVGQFTSWATTTIPITLASSPKKVYFRPLKNSEDA